ncbi:MAG: hypothetical protein PHS06_02100 [Candidatus Shapirobacteria bacterium]|nr:hypothetical protein [Candidatus Shapirobacteria bacterium]
MKKENFIQKFFKRIQKWYVTLPDKKRYFELLTAILSIPMILTVILVNMSTINKSKESSTPTPTTAPIQVVVENPTSGSGNINPPKINITPTPTPTKVECKKEIGEIEILSPQEGEIITSSDLCINISTNNNYCPVVWSYKLDNDNWSEFSNNNICLYNLTSGKKTLQVKIKSTVVDKTITLQRNFTYQNSALTTPTTTPTNN